MAIYSLAALASGLIRMSILLIYRRLPGRVLSVCFRWLFQTIIALVGAFTITFAILPIFVCNPISAFWDQLNDQVAEDYHYNCLNEGAGVVAYGIISTAQNLATAILPTLLCWNLPLVYRQKGALCGLFIMAYMAVAIGGMRAYTGYRIFFQTYDVTWVASDALLWSLLEIHIGSICANLPALETFFVHFFMDGGQSRYRFDKSKLQHTINKNTVAGSTRSLSTLWKKVHFWRQPRNANESTYLWNLHANTSSREHGRIVQMSAHFKPHYEQDDVISRPCAPEYLETIIPRSNHTNSIQDIEAGNVPSVSSANIDKKDSLSSIVSPASIRWPLPPNHAFKRPQRICWDRQGKYFVWTPWEKSIEVPERTSSKGKRF